MPNNVLYESNIAIATLNIVDAVILVMDKEGRIIIFNKAAESLTGYKFAEIENLYPWDLFIPDEQVEQVKQVFSQLTAGHFPNKHTNFWLTKDRSKRLIDWSNSAITDKNGDISFIIATGIDVTDKKAAENEIRNHINSLEESVSKRTSELTEANAKLEYLARTDGLTNIFNRRYFDEVIETEIRRSKRSGECLTLLICDVDFFKSYNDIYGHVAGDNCLIKIAAILDGFFNRSADFVARYGGEEFIVIMPGVDSEHALTLSNKLIKEIQNHNLPHGSSLISEVVTISVGLVTREHTELINSASLIEEADKALYQAKNNGRNRVHLFSEGNL